MTNGTIPQAAGIGLRFAHHKMVVETRPAVAWLEVHAENYMGGGAPIRLLESVRRDYPLSLHGTGLSLGSADGLDLAHLARLQELVRRVEPGLISEHLSWSAIGKDHFPDLLPLPLTEDALVRFCENVNTVQDFLQRRILIENPSSYVRFSHSMIPEWEFLTAVAVRTGCGILCDLNNIYVSASNFGWDCDAYLAALPPAFIGEIHLAGHSRIVLEDGSPLRLDDHASRVSAEVWSFYRRALERFGPVPTLIEWDADIPALSVLLQEAAMAERILAGHRCHAHA
jgi:uncharacterized protein (UPF0276 family)